MQKERVVVINIFWRIYSVAFIALVILSGCSNRVPFDSDAIPEDTTIRHTESIQQKTHTVISNQDLDNQNDAADGIGHNEYTQAEVSLPRGFDGISFSIYQSGVLDEFLPVDVVIFQCLVADLNMDGSDDVIITFVDKDSIDSEYNRNFPLETMILTGSENGHVLAARNPKATAISSYDGGDVISAGPGWFKITSSAGKAGGYEYNYLFKYDESLENWVYAEYYENWYGYTELGQARIETPAVFGHILFEEFCRHYRQRFDYTQSPNNLSPGFSVQDESFSVKASPYYVYLQDKEKEAFVNALIVDDLELFSKRLRTHCVNADVSLYPTVTFQTPEIISIEYRVSGLIEIDSLINYGGVNRKYITTVIDINNMQRIQLADVIDIDALIEVIMASGFSDNWTVDSEGAYNSFFAFSNQELSTLLRSSDDLEAPFGNENTGVFFALREKSLCLYFQPEFFGAETFSKEPKLYVFIDDILPYVKLDYWNAKSEAASHIIWIG